MPRKPNYSFERMQRDRAKQAKQEEKRAVRAQARAGGLRPEDEADPADGEVSPDDGATSDAADDR